MYDKHKMNAFLGPLEARCCLEASVTHSNGIESVLFVDFSGARSTIMHK